MVWAPRTPSGVALLFQSNNLNCNTIYKQWKPKSFGLIFITVRRCCITNFQWQKQWYALFIQQPLNYYFHYLLSILIEKGNLKSSHILMSAHSGSPIHQASIAEDRGVPTVPHAKLSYTTPPLSHTENVRPNTQCWASFSDQPINR